MTTDKALPYWLQSVTDALDDLHARIDTLAETLETLIALPLPLETPMIDPTAKSPSYSCTTLDDLRARVATLEDVLARQSGRLEGMEKQVWAAGNEIEALLERQQAVENLVCAYRERLERLENNHQASLDNLARRLERLEANHQASLATAIRLIMRCVPILDLQISEHNDCHRLRRAISDYLADAGYPGWLSSRARNDR